MNSVNYFIRRHVFTVLDGRRKEVRVDVTPEGEVLWTSLFNPESWVSLTGIFFTVY